MGIVILMLTLRKKAYLLGFSFKFKQIKFYALFMDWLFQEKMFIYFLIHLGLWIACII